MPNNTIAVLPFTNMSSDPENAFFSDGMTEEIINALARIEALKVTSRTSSFHFKGKHLPIPEIAAQLNVEIILEGSIRVANGMMRITAQLIQAKADYHFWSETWDRKLDNMFEVQDDISLRIADKLREQVGHFEIGEHLVGKQTENLDAYAYALKARTLFNNWNPDDVNQAIELYEKALALDPNHAASYVGLADAYGFLATTEFIDREVGWRKAAECTYKARELDAENAGVHYQLSNLSFFTQANYREAFAHNKKAIELKPSYPEAQQFMAFYYTVVDNFPAAKEHLNIAHTIDPLSNETLFFKAYYDHCHGRYEDALHKLNQCLEANPKNIPALFTRCYVFILLGKYDQVLDDLAALPENAAIYDEVLGIRCLCFIHLKMDDEAREALEELEQRSENQGAFQAHSYVFLAYAARGENDKAFQWLDHLIEIRSAIVLLSFSDPLVGELVEDERYPQYFEKLYGDVATTTNKRSAKQPLLNANDASGYKQKLIAFMREEAPYLNPGLSLRLLADMVGLNPNQLSWLLNEEVGKNFNEFVNSYRIERFKELALDPQNAHISLIGLAYESGFNSKTVFNTTFKRLTGKTPKAYLASQS